MADTQDFKGRVALAIAKQTQDDAVIAAFNYDDQVSIEHAASRLISNGITEDGEESGVEENESDGEEVVEDGEAEGDEEEKDEEEEEEEEEDNEEAFCNCCLQVKSLFDARS